MRQWIVGILGCIAISAFGAPVDENVQVERALNWMSGNPVMSKASSSIESVETFPDLGSYSVYVVQLNPKGYLILNSDDDLPLLVSFSAESRVDLSDNPQNALRAMLIGYCERMADELANPVASAAKTLLAATAVDELHGPFLETSWNQSEPYNNFCPSGAPVGCVPTTFAQLMNYHRWPYFGTGSRSYTDSSGSNTGAHSAGFSNPYEWGAMLAGHSSGDPQVNQDAVAELMFELGVAAGVNYESSSTSGNSQTLGSSLGEYGYFGTIEAHDDDLIAPMEAELRAGFPCVVAYPGHAFVADGLMVDGGITTYHFNMGWGGYNNGWYASDAAPTGSGSAALNESITSFRPQLIAFPQTNTVSGAAGDSSEIKWILPKRLEDQVSKLTIKQLTQQSGNWSSDASAITGMNSGWEVIAGGHPGDCWYSRNYGTSSMVLKEIFVPDASAQFTFWMKYLLVEDPFTISVSVDGGASYAVLLSEDGQSDAVGWKMRSVSLAAYAGQEIQIKISLRVEGSYYPTGGVWLDDLAVTSGDWYDWQTFVEDTTLASRRFSSATTAWDDCDDFSIFEVTSTSAYKDWEISTDSGVDHCFYKEPGGYTNHRYHLTSRSTISPGSSTRLLIHGKYKAVYDESFRVMVSTDRVSFTEIWSVQGSVDWGDIMIDLSAYAGQAVYIRLEYYYPEGSYTSGGGVWIDSISTQELTHPELEGQPVHYTALMNLPAGMHTLAAVLTDTDAVEHAVGPAFTLTVSGGDDGDGIPEAWEILYGLDPDVDDGGLDPDEDGFSNWQEYICGTVPTNAASVWKLTMGSGSLPAFQGLDNRIYTIEYCDGLASNDWKSVATGIVGSNGLFEVSNFESVTNVCRFYRVKVQEAE